MAQGTTVIASAALGANLTHIALVEIYKKSKTKTAVNSRI